MRTGSCGTAFIVVTRVVVRTREMIRKIALPSSCWWRPSNRIRPSPEAVKVSTQSTETPGMSAPSATAHTVATRRRPTSTGS
ncbi:MAG: hypothetical protein JWN31_1579 [Frankiales bacterium]|nr:hypothetical protein [Frankiales bacterium]